MRKLNRPTTLVVFGLLLASLLALYGQWVLRGWFVEDAAISFAFARNLGEGWGLVRYPGDERVEGFSNPLWVLILAAGHAVGISSFDASKVLSAGLAPLTLFATAAVMIRGRMLLGFAVVAAVVLGTDATFVIWSASGLENPLFMCLLAFGLWRTLEEAEHGGFSWAAVCFLGLALTRPEGIAYAALGGLWALVLEATGRRRWHRIVLWLGVFWAPFLVYHAVRYAWFAFPLPSTYYAKLDRTPYWWHINTYGWTYLRKYATATHRMWFLPVFFIGATSLKGVRAPLVFGISFITAVLLLLPGVEPLKSLAFWPTIDLPRWWSTVQVAWVFGLALFLPLLSSCAPGWRVRMVSWWMVQLGLLFIIVSGGDWMRGYRWVSLIAVPLALLFALGLQDLYQLPRSLFGRRPDALVLGGLFAGSVGLGAVVPELLYQSRYRPETTPFSVLKRVRHYRWAMEQLYLEKADILDHDMGAMLFWGTDLGVVRDTKGLADIAFAYQNGEPSFVTEYAWEEYPFDLCHAHATTGRILPRIRKHWRQEYFEFPGYGGHSPHQGNYMRKSIIVHPWEGSTDREVRFAEGAVLHGIDLPNTTFSPPYGLHVDFALTRETGNEDFRLLLFLFNQDNEVKAVAGVPQGFEAFYPIDQWKNGEVVNQRVSFKTKGDIGVGTYHLGAVIIGPKGVYTPESFGPDVSVPEVPLFAPGEVHFGVEIQLVGSRQAEERALKMYPRALAAAEEGTCDRAHKLWWKARLMQARSTDWWKNRRHEMYGALASCYANRAQTHDTRELAVKDMLQALHYQRSHPDVLAIAPGLTQPWYDEALMHLDADELEQAHELLVDVIRVDPSRSWARRTLEDLRKVRLKLR